MFSSFPINANVNEYIDMNDFYFNLLMEDILT